MNRKEFISASGIMAFIPLFIPGALSAKVMAAPYDITIRGHHFFDIIQTLGVKKDQDLVQAKTKHSYHSVTHAIRDNANLKMKIVLSVDSVCEGCIHNVENMCTSATKKTGLKGLNEYNTYLDKRIMNICKIEPGQIVTPKEICRVSDKYIDNLEFIYELNDEENNHKRKKEFIEGVRYYSKRNNFSLKFIES